MDIPAEESTYKKAHIPEGIHHAELIAVLDTPDGQFGPRVALDFDVYYSMKEGPAKIGRVFGKKLTPKSKLWEAFEALGLKPEVGKSFDTNKILGSACRVVVEDYRDNDGNMVSGITKVKAPDNETKGYLSTTKKALNKIREESSRDPVPIEQL